MCLFNNEPPLRSCLMVLSYKWDHRKALDVLYHTNDEEGFSLCCSKCPPALIYNAAVDTGHSCVGSKG